MQSIKPDTCIELSHIDSPEMCAVLPLEGGNFPFVRLIFSNQLKRRTLIDTGSYANALTESLFTDLNLNNPKSLTLEKPSFNSVRMASGQKVPIAIKARISFQIGLHLLQDKYFDFTY